MIELRVEPYCHDCFHFDVCSTTSCLHSDCLHSDGSSYTVISTLVTCKNAEKCREIEKHIANHFCEKENEKC